MVSFFDNSHTSPKILDLITQIDDGHFSEVYVLGKNCFAESVIQNFSIKAVVDDFGDDTSWHNLTIVKSNEVPKNSVVISTSLAIYPQTAVKNILKVGAIAVHYLELVKHSKKKLRAPEFLEMSKKHILENKDEYESMYKRLYDKKSKDIFKKIINFRLGFNLEFLKDFKVDFVNQYFEDFLELNEEYFVDAGGFHGETSIEFIKRCKNFKRIFLLEPCADSMSIAKKNLSEAKNIHFLQVGLSDVNENVSFDAESGSANSIGKGDSTIEVNTLDSLINDQVSFIKMDLEGYEDKALLGAKNTIRTYHPKLAISVYHKFNDLIEIPKLVLGFRKDYDLFLRHYTEGTDETVMFFIPKLNNG